MIYEFRLANSLTYVIVLLDGDVIGTIQKDSTGDFNFSRDSYPSVEHELHQSMWDQFDGWAEQSAERSLRG